MSGSELIKHVKECFAAKNDRETIKGLVALKAIYPDRAGAIDEVIGRIEGLIATEKLKWN